MKLYVSISPLCDHTHELEFICEHCSIINNLDYQRIFINDGEESYIIHVPLSAHTYFSFVEEQHEHNYKSYAEQIKEKDYYFVTEENEDD